MLINLLSLYDKEDFPLLVDFLEQYYVSVETQETQSPFDLLNNIDKYVNVEQLTGLKSSTVLSEDIDTVTDTISVDGNFTEGFPRIMV